MFGFSRINIWLAAAGAFLMALIGAYVRGRSDAGKIAKAKADAARLRRMETAREVEDEIESMDDERLSRIASEYVRGND